MYFSYYVTILLENPNCKEINCSEGYLESVQLEVFLGGWVHLFVLLMLSVENEFPIIKILLAARRMR